MTGKVTLTFTTSAFADKCPDCGAGIRYVQFGGPRVGYDEYPGFQFVQYECRADYYFDDRREILEADRVLCPSTRRSCAMCGEKVGGLVMNASAVQKFLPFCSEWCAASWAMKNVPAPAPARAAPEPRKLYQYYVAHGCWETIRSDARVVENADGSLTCSVDGGQSTFASGSWRASLWPIPAAASMGQGSMLLAHGSTPCTRCGLTWNLHMSGTMSAAAARGCKSFVEPKEQARLLDVPSGGHDYGEITHRKDCGFGCGAWMGSSRSGAPEGIDPFGACPKNPVNKRERE